MGHENGKVAVSPLEDSGRPEAQRIDKHSTWLQRYFPGSTAQTGITRTPEQSNPSMVKCINPTYIRISQISHYLLYQRRVTYVPSCNNQLLAHCVCGLRVSTRVKLLEQEYQSCATLKSAAWQLLMILRQDAQLKRLGR